jgi:hypothetical protein
MASKAQRRKKKNEAIKWKGEANPIPIVVADPKVPKEPKVYKEDVLKLTLDHSIGHELWKAYRLVGTLCKATKAEVLKVLDGNKEHLKLVIEALAEYRVSLRD